MIPTRRPNCPALIRRVGLVGPGAQFVDRGSSSLVRCAVGERSGCRDDPDAEPVPAPRVLPLPRSICWPRFPAQPDEDAPLGGNQGHPSRTGSLDFQAVERPQFEALSEPARLLGDKLQETNPGFAVPALPLIKDLPLPRTNQDFFSLRRVRDCRAREGQLGLVRTGPDSDCRRLETRSRPGRPGRV